MIPIQDLRQALDLPIHVILQMARLPMPEGVTPPAITPHLLQAIITVIPLPAPIARKPYAWDEDALIDWRRRIAVSRPEDRTPGETYFYNKTYCQRWRNIVENPYSRQKRSVILLGKARTLPRAKEPPTKIDP